MQPHPFSFARLLALGLTSASLSPPLQTKRDECIAVHGPESTECAKLIEAHKACLRKEGFHVE